MRHAIAPDFSDIMSMDRKKIIENAYMHNENPPHRCAEVFMTQSTMEKLDLAALGGFQRGLLATSPSPLFSTTRCSN